MRLSGALAAPDENTRVISMVDIPPRAPAGCLKEEFVGRWLDDEVMG